MSVLEDLTETIDFIRSRTQAKPKLGIVLGSGLGSFVNCLDVEVAIPYVDIPCFPGTSVEGHKGQLVIGKIHGLDVAVLQGRVHYYEGHPMSKVVFPVRTLALLGTEVLMLTNSAGGIEPQMQPGDFMVIEDHINLMGDNPLKGPNIKNFGPRFPDMTEAYDKKLSAAMVKVLSEQNVRHWRGVYCGVSGPTYETPAEVRYLQGIGGMAVGMSTVPETIAANHMGLRVCALSCITNLASGLSSQKLSHEEVTQKAKDVETTFNNFITQFIKEMSL